VEYATVGGWPTRQGVLLCKQVALVLFAQTSRVRRGDGMQSRVDMNCMLVDDEAGKDRGLLSSSERNHTNMKSKGSTVWGGMPFA